MSILMARKRAGGGWNAIVAAVAIALVTVGMPFMGARADPLTRALWIFGDSIIDVGNNNYLVTLAKANFPYNGIDFPAGPTGRFCNGDTVLDVLSAFIGFTNSTPPYLRPDIAFGGNGILEGVSYASAAGGILNETGRNYAILEIPGSIIFRASLSFDAQISLFQNTLLQLQSQLGSQDAVQDLLNDSLFPIIIGSNDYINNYLLPNSTTSTIPAADYQNILISNLRRQLTTLYNLGGRQFLVTGLGPLGCIPSQLAQNNSTGACVDFVNQLASNYNTALRALLQELRSALAGSAFLYANVYDLSLSIIGNPGAFGFTVTNIGCCGSGAFNGEVACAQFLLVNLCPDRTQYVFWDPFHPSESVNQILGRALFDGGTDVITPINVRQLLSGS